MNQSKVIRIALVIWVLVSGIGIAIFLLGKNEDGGSGTEFTEAIISSDPGSESRSVSDPDHAVTEESPDISSAEENEPTDSEEIPDMVVIEDGKPPRLRIPTYQEIDDLLAETDPVEAYRDGDFFVRQAIIANLSDKLAMGDYMLDLLALEDDSALRSSLFINYRTPNSFFMGLPDEKPVDKTLERALDMPMGTNIEPAEYVSRVKISMSENPRLGMDQARLAKEAWPDDEHLQFVAAETMLRANQMTGGLDPGEQESAYDTIIEELNRDPNDSNVTPSERLSGFAALSDWGSPDERRIFLTEQLAIETDPRAIDMLVRMMESIPRG